MQVERAKGRVWLIGAGPGAPDLLTLRAARLLAAADIVFFDALVHPETIALAAKAKKVAVGKRCGQVSADQRFINAHLVEAASHHEVVVRLKGGDPMLFGRAQEEIAELEAAGIEFEVVPGITAALAASAQLGISLTRRGISRTVTFATPRVGDGEDEAANQWIDSAAKADTTVLYMAAGRAASHAQELIAAGRSLDTPVIYIESATLPEERRIATTLGGLRSGIQGAGGPALLCIGEVYREYCSLSASGAQGIPVGPPKASGQRPLDAVSSQARMRPEAEQHHHSFERCSLN